MANYKIIFTGPVGAGKTTAITSLSDTPPVTTDEAATDMAKGRKPATTVAMDYGVLKLADGEKIHLYGTPGQERFDFMWQILTTGGLGLILLLDNTRSDPFTDMRFFLDSFKAFIDQTKVVIGVTQMDLRAYPTIEDYQAQLRRMGVNIPVFEVDARERKDMSILLQALLYSLDPALKEAEESEDE